MAERPRALYISLGRHRTGLPGRSGGLFATGGPQISHLPLRIDAASGGIDSQGEIVRVLLLACSWLTMAPAGQARTVAFLTARTR